MRSLTIVTALLLAIGNTYACLCAQDAYGVADNFQHLFKNYTKAFAERALSKDFTDQTDSVAWLINNGTECPHPVSLAALLSKEVWLCSKTDCA